MLLNLLCKDFIEVMQEKDMILNININRIINLEIKEIYSMKNKF